MGKMRFRRSNSAIIPRQKPKFSIGRPKKEEGESAHRKIRISGKLLNMILDYREADSAESYNETILRMLSCKTQTIVEQSERIKQLEYKIQQLIPTDASPSVGTVHIDDRDSLENISCKDIPSGPVTPPSPSPSPSPSFSCHHKNCDFHTGDERGV